MRKKKPKPKPWEMPMPFGKYEGMPLGEVWEKDQNYIFWILDNLDWISFWLRNAIDLTIHHAVFGDEPEIESPIPQSRIPKSFFDNAKNN